MPFLRSAAPSRVKTRNLPSGVVMMSFTRRVLATIESVTHGFAGSLMSIVYITSPPPPDAEVRVLAVRVDPDLLGAEPRARQAAHDRQRPPNVARLDAYDRVGGSRPKAGGDCVLARLVADECAVRVDHPLPRRERPARRKPSDPRTSPVLHGGLEADDVPLPHPRRGRRYLDGSDWRGDDLHRKRRLGISRAGGDRRAPRRHRRHQTGVAHAYDGGHRAAPCDLVATLVTGR